VTGGEQPFRDKGRLPAGQHRVRLSPFLVFRGFQQAQPGPDGHLVTGHEAEDRRHVVRADGRHAAAAPLRRAHRRAVVPVGEPQHHRAEDALLSQVVGDPGVDRAQVFADRDRAGPGGGAGQCAH